MPPKVGRAAKAKAKAKGGAKAKAKPKAGPKALPKAKAKAKAKARALAKAAVRRAALRVGRRPAAAVETEDHNPEYRFNEGKQVISELVGPFAWTPDLLVSFEGSYWGAPCKFAGLVKSYGREGEVQELVILLTGTTSERLQAWGSKQKDKRFRVHLCSNKCSGERIADDLGHGHLVQKIPPDLEEPWMKSLEGGDELPDLRHALGVGPEDESKSLGSSGSPSRDKKHKKKKDRRKKKEIKKDKKDERKGKEKSAPDLERKKRRREGSSESRVKVLAQKDLAAVFGHTGLDPSPSLRKKIRRKVRRATQKGKKKSSSSTSSSKSSSLESENHLFNETKKVKLIARKAPGALAAQAIDEMKESLLTASGQMWGQEESSVPPLVVHYFRSVLRHRMSGGVAREGLTLSLIADLALQGRIAQSLDVLFQRLKSMELTAGGADYRVSQRIELAPLELDMVASSAERKEAVQESQTEWKLRQQSSKGEDRDPHGKGKKGEWKGGKGKGSWNDGKDDWRKKGDEKGKEDDRRDKRKEKK